MKNLGLLANTTKPRAAEILTRIGEKAAELGLSLVACEETARLLANAKPLPESKLCERIDALLALGGDGTMLRAVRLLDGRQTPVMGINIGGLGFLTSVSESDIDRALQSLSRGDYTTSTRTIVDCRLRHTNGTEREYRALNDVVVSSGASLRVVTLDVAVDQESVTCYVCDGLVVSTPTGSTGHSMSAGGPILHPATQAFVISPLCPHTLSTRPLVVPDTSVLEVRVAESGGDVALSVDGQIGQILGTGDALTIKRSPKSASFVHMKGHSYFSVLRQKLHWRGSSV